jgi:hypothetical protein
MALVKFCLIQATNLAICSLGGSATLNWSEIFSSCSQTRTIRSEIYGINTTSLEPSGFNWRAGHAVAQHQTERIMKLRKPTSPHLVSFAGARPLALTKRQAITALGSSKLVARMLWASRYSGVQWLVIMRLGRDLLIDTASVEAAYERLLGGEQPPLMPSERRSENNAPSV